MIERLLLDLDGVLVKLSAGICRHYNKPWPYTENRQYPWKIAPEIGMTDPEVWDSLSYEFWRDLEPFPHMKEFVGLLEERFGAENICLLTAPIEGRHCMDGKRAWIRKHLPAYSQRFLIGTGKFFCAAPNHALIDDREKNVKLFKKAGGQALLVPAPWNHRFSEAPLEALKTWLKQVEGSRVEPQ